MGVEERGRRLFEAIGREARLARIADPWARREAWRYPPPLRGWTRLRTVFPGLGIALAAFGLYVLCDAVRGRQ